MRADQHNALCIEAANYWPSRQGHVPRYVIIHGTAGGSTARGIANYFAQSTTEASTHYVIGVDGEFAQCVPETAAAWANGVLTTGHDSFWNPSINPNLITISIEFCKPSTDNSNDITDAQKQTGFPLVRAICDRWSIPKRRADVNGGIAFHCSIDPVERSGCPGPFPLDELITFLEEDEVKILQANETNGHYVEVASNRWHCTTAEHNFDVALGMLDFYRKVGQVGLNGLTILGLPASDEIGIKDHPKSTIQRFERGVLCYNPAKDIDNPPGAGDIFFAHLYDGGIGTDPIVVSLEHDLTALKNQQITPDKLSPDLQNKLVVLDNAIKPLLP